MKKSKKEVIVMTTRELTKRERREYAQKHPGERLCFRLRYPNFPMFISVIALLLVLLPTVLRGILR